MPDDIAAITSALETWAPTWPRRVTRQQTWVESPTQAAMELYETEGTEISPYISTFAFPRGHTKNNNIPEIDTLFIDFDFEDGDYVRGSGNVNAWRRDMSRLLVRVRLVAQRIQENGRPGWRAALSGHKGVHLFLDFPPLNAELGTFRRYVNGVNDYATDLIQQLADDTGLSDLRQYVDVTSSDLGRLCRAPNTLHEGATESFGEERFCVPVTIDELASIDPDEYLELTRARREPPYSERTPNARVNEVLTQYVKNASDGSHNPTGGMGSSTVNWNRVDDYRERSNDNISLADVKFLTADRPCVWRFYERDDKYRHGFQSHYMEMFCIRELLEKNVPIDIIKEFLDSAPEYDDDYSQRRIEQIISRGYNRFRVDTVQQNAPEFVGYDDCGYCQQVLNND